MKLLNFFVGLASIAYRVLVVMLIWALLVSPVFGVDELGYAEAFAVTVILTMFKTFPNYNEIKPTSTEDSLKNTAFRILTNSMLLLIAFIVSLFI
jgi:hypothetical protein